MEKPTATPTVTPWESVESARESSVPAAEGTAAAAAVAAAGAADDVTEKCLGAAPERGATAAGAEEGREITEEDGRGSGDDDAHRAAAAESLAARLQEQLEVMKVRRARRTLVRPQQGILCWPSLNSTCKYADRPLPCIVGIFVFTDVCRC